MERKNGLITTDTLKDILDMFNRKGLKPKGPNPANGQVTFVNPNSGRAYHIDLNHPLPKGPHIGIGRPRGSRNGPLGRS